MKKRSGKSTYIVALALFLCGISYLAYAGLSDGRMPFVNVSEALAAIRLPQRKISYLKDLAHWFAQSPKDALSWVGESDDAVAEQLLALRGLGRWNVEMFLIFHLGRPNVLPLDDAGLIQGISLNHFSGDPVSRSDAREVAEAWKPWCTVATWYIWRSLEAQPVAG